MGLRTYLDNKTCFDEISHQTHGSNEFKLQFLSRNQTKFRKVLTSLSSVFYYERKAICFGGMHGSC